MSAETFAAVIESGKVVNMVVVAADSPLLTKNSNWVFVGENPQKVGIGWGYNGTIFIAPPPPPPIDVTQP
jgi:hypothetical protein